MANLKLKLNNPRVKEYPELESLTVIPTLEQQTFKPNKYGYSNVTVEKMAGTNLVVEPTKEPQELEGLYSKVNVVGDENLVSDNIKKGSTIFGVEGSQTVVDTSDADVTSDLMAQGSTAYVKGEKVQGNLPMWYDLTYTPDSIRYEQMGEEEYLTLTHTNNYKYITHPEKDIVTRFRIYNESKLASAINLTSDKLKQGETILGVEGTLESLDTSDATAIAENIIQGQTAYVNGEKITGTMPIKDKLSRLSTNIQNGEALISATFNLNSANKGYYDEETPVTTKIAHSKIAEAIELTSDKIAQGETVLGVEGTFAGGGDVAITDARYLFYGGSRLDYMNEILALLKDVTSTTSMFYSCSSLTEIPLFDTSNVTTMNYMFDSCTGLTEIPSFDTSNVTNVSGLFYRCSNLTKIPLLDFSSIDTVSSVVNSNSNLTTLGGFKNLGKAYTQKSNNHSSYKLDLSKSTLLTHDSLMNVINNLYDLNLTYDVANGGTLYTQQLVLGATNLAKLTEEEIAIATNKGWTVS